MIITSYKKGFVAHENIVVYKRLVRRGNIWKTSGMCEEVTLDSELISTWGTTPRIKDLGQYQMICWKKADLFMYEEEDEVCFKAIIPKGTRFWISDDLRQVASEKLWLTSGMGKAGEETDLSSLYLKYCLNLLLWDGRKVRWSPKINPKDVEGIYICGSQAIDIRVYESIFSRYQLSKLPWIGNPEMADNDLDGRGRTKYLKEKYPDIEILQALHENTYIPSYGELTIALRKLLLLNLTRRDLGLEILEPSWIWSSTPYTDESFWFIGPTRYIWSGLGYTCWIKNQVWPFVK